MERKCGVHTGLLGHEPWGEMLGLSSVSLLLYWAQMTWHESATPRSKTSYRVTPAEGYLGCETHEWLISAKKLKLSPILSIASVDFWKLVVQGTAFLFVRADILYIDSRESDNVVVVFCIQERDLHHWFRCFALLVGDNTCWRQSCLFQFLHFFQSWRFYSPRVYLPPWDNECFPDVRFHKQSTFCPPATGCLSNSGFSVLFSVLKDIMFKCGC